MFVVYRRTYSHFDPIKTNNADNGNCIHATSPGMHAIADECASTAILHYHAFNTMCDKVLS